MLGTTFLNMNKTTVQSLTDCEICMAQDLPQEHYLEHMEQCAKDSNVLYLLKMSALHEFKSQDISRHVSLHYKANLMGSEIHLPRGVCYYCETPQAHRNGNCQKVSRVAFLTRVIERTSDDFFWNLNQSHEFLIKAIVGMVELRQRKEMAPVYEEMKSHYESIAKCEPIPSDATEWPVSTAKWIQEKRRVHQEALDARGAQIQAACQADFNTTSANREKCYNGLMIVLAKTDKEEPVRNRTFS